MLGLQVFVFGLLLTASYIDSLVLLGPWLGFATRAGFFHLGE